MTTPRKLVYGVLNGTVYAASGPALLRAIAGIVLRSDESFTMGQLRDWFGARMADNLVLETEEDEDPSEGDVERPIADEVVLTHDNIFEDQVEDYTWIEHAMWEELPGSVRALGAQPSYRGGLGLREEQLPEIERLLGEEGFDIVRDDALIALIEDDDIGVDGLLEAKAALIAHLGSWEAPD
ncbi:hypothetical protein QOL99_04695 [Deinococcus sp. MIMF12]|uniref:TerB family tellurite resistance protein n=1 Tax=Deinococcus rhizophilus TaxID=3049544 RepID=A0ABT7JHM3_9DEIO|nr:hypothetical protein [Deinococcus rhizophilus]MDL2343448.1 hypothetical protein [Deinococcus rhizophilus]